MATVSKNNPDARRGNTNHGTPMKHAKVCFECGDMVTHVRDQEMVRVGRTMQARHKKDTGGKCQKSAA